MRTLRSIALVFTLGCASSPAPLPAHPTGPGGWGAVTQGVASYVRKNPVPPGGRYVELWVSVADLSGRADQAASLAIRRYTGTLSTVPGLGDAAYYTDSALSRSGPRPQALVTARAEGRQMRVITLSTFLGGRPEKKIVKLARAVLERI